jgi:hypothetical protein
MIFAAAFGVCWLPFLNRQNSAPRANTRQAVPPFPSSGLARSRSALWNALRNYAKLPLSFEPTTGELHHGTAKYLSHGKGYTMGLTSDGVVLSLRKPRDRKQSATPLPSSPARHKSTNADSALVEMKLLGANPAASVSAAGELPGKTNYLIGNDPKKWRINVPNYEKVKYQGVYPGIDLVYYGNQQQLEYDFVVAPGASPNAIHLSLRELNATSSGTPTLRIAANGDLLTPICGGELRVHKPIAYQLDAERRRQYVAASYVLQPRSVTFALGSYDPGRPLVIDPVLGYSTYLGGSDDENDETYGAIAVDLLGNAYVTGDADSSNFPVKKPFQPSHAPGDDSDAFVTKLSADGASVVYSTFLGGTGGDQGYAVGVDLVGHAYVAGSTLSADFPVTAGAFHKTYKGTGILGYGDGFVTKLSADGSSLVYSTYLGGSSDDGVNAIAIDLLGCAYVTGSTSSTDFPVTPGSVQPAYGGAGTDALGDGFVTKLSADGALVYSTFLGGSDDDSAFGITLDVFGNAYVAGTTNSVTFPVTPNSYQTTFGSNWDGFVAKLNAAGSKLVYSTYLGGSDFDLCYGLALDVLGNAYVTGLTLSTNFPVSANAYQKKFHGSGPKGDGDGFVAKLNPTGKTLMYSTYLGGSGDDFIVGIVVDIFGNDYVTGWTNSNDFLVTPGAFQTTYGGTGPNQYGDSLLTVVNPQGSGLRYSTYFGGSGDDRAGGIARDLAGNIYITGATNSPNFAVTKGAFQTTFAGSGAAPENSGDGFVTKFNWNLF